jgi:hypothetical protein
VGGAATIASAPARPTAGRLRREVRTTPGRLRLLSLAVVAVLAIAGVLTYGAVARRTSGVRTVSGSEPLIVDAQALDTALAQADATETNAFLGGGIEPADQRALYQADVATAAQLLADAAERSGPAASVQGPLRTIAAQLPVYTGLVDTARADNRQGFPVGAAYLRQASRLMAGTILPAAHQLYTVHAARLDQGNARARSAHDTALVTVLLFVVVLVLLGAQIWLYARSHRLVNPPVVAATLLAAVLFVVVFAELRAEASAAARARDRSYASVDLLAQVRTAAFRAKGDESLTLIGRGNGGAFDDDFDTQSATLGPLLDQAQGVAVSAAEQAKVRDATVALQQYLTVHRSIRSLDDGGKFDDAVKLAVGGGTGSAANRAFAAFDAPVTDALNTSQADFVAHISTGRHRLGGLTTAIVVVMLASGALALYGFQKRINEYR